MTTKQYNNLYITFFSGLILAILYILTFLILTSSGAYSFFTKWLSFLLIPLNLLNVFIFLLWIPNSYLAPRGIIDRLPYTGWVDMLFKVVPKTKKNNVYIAGAIIPVGLFLIYYIYNIYRFWWN